MIMINTTDDDITNGRDTSYTNNNNKYDVNDSSTFQHQHESQQQNFHKLELARANGGTVIILQPTLTQLPLESIVHCLSFLHSKEIFKNLIPVCKLFQQLTYARQLWDSIFFCTPKSTDVSVEVLDKFPIKHVLVNSKHFSLSNLLRMQAGLHTFKSVILSSVSVDYRNFVILLNGITGVERLTLDRIKVINYFEPPVEESIITNTFEHLHTVEFKWLLGDYETRLKILQIVVSRCKNVTSLTMSKNNPLLLPDVIYQKFHPEMNLESLSLEEEHLFHQNHDNQILDKFFERHCSRLRKLTLVNCRHRFDTMLIHCRHSLEQLIVVSGFWGPPLNSLPYPTLTRLSKLTMISCHIQVVERILSDCLSEAILQIKLSGPPRNHQSTVFFKSPHLKSFKSHYALPYTSLAPIIMTCESSLECLEFAFAKRTLLQAAEWQSVIHSLSDSLLHLSIDNVKFNDQWWLMKLLRDLVRLETLRIDTASGDAQQEIEETCIIISHSCRLRVLILEECDITVDCFDQVLQYCGSTLEQLSYDFSYDKQETIADKMRSITSQCTQVSLTINCMDQVPSTLEMFMHELPMVTFNVRDLSLEDMVLLAVICDKVKQVEFNKDQGANNFDLLERADQSEQVLLDNQTLNELLERVIMKRIASISNTQKENLLSRYLSFGFGSHSRHDNHTLGSNLRGLMKSISPSSDTQYTT